MGGTMPKYMQAVLQSTSFSEIQTSTVQMVKEAIDVVFPGKKVVIKDDVEPQSEVEEVKQDVELMDAIIRETKIFNEAVKNYGITHEEDLLQLKESKRMMSLEKTK
jgi:hypothetical protein